jgi:hypothetical protein
MSRASDWWNETTGEQATGMLLVKGAKYPRGVEFATTFADAFAYLANLGLTLTEWRVLSTMIAGMTFGNYVAQTQRSIAQALKLADSNVSKAVRRLIREGLVGKAELPGTDLMVLRVSPLIAWRGNAKQWNRAINDGEAVGFAPIPYRKPVSNDNARVSKRPSRAEDFAAA